MKQNKVEALKKLLRKTGFAPDEPPTIYELLERQNFARLKVLGQEIVEKIEEITEKPSMSFDKFDERLLKIMVVRLTKGGIEDPAPKRELCALYEILIAEGIIDNAPGNYYKETENPPMIYKKENKQRWSEMFYPQH